MGAGAGAGGEGGEEVVGLGGWAASCCFGVAWRGLAWPGLAFFLGEVYGSGDVPVFYYIFRR